MTNWTGVWTVLGPGMDRTGYRYRQSWVGVWTFCPALCTASCTYIMEVP